MAAQINHREIIAAALRAFETRPLVDASRDLFATLGYRSERRLDLTPNTPAQFLATFAQGKPFDAERALLGDWRSVDFLFQLTDAEVQTATSGQGRLPFDSTGRKGPAPLTRPPPTSYKSTQSRRFARRAVLRG